MTRQIHLNAFTMACPSPQFWGAWTHPLDQSAAGFTSLDYWIDLVKTLERGCFDAVFFADTMGVSDTYGGTEAAALRNGVFSPALDPMPVVAALASHTRHLGFALTHATSSASPYYTARLFSSLDHLTRGRIGWNVVTTANKVTEANGVSAVVEHDKRYDIADEYLDVCYALWEGSWDEDAVRIDRDSRVLVDLARVHRIDHAGKYFKVRGPHQVPPSPQRTPVIYQAGGSPRGTAFAGRHAEAVFVNQQPAEAVRGAVARIRDEAAANGRDPEGVKVLMGYRCLVGADESDVARKRALMLEHSSAEGALAMFGAWTGIDVGSLADDVRLADLESNDFASLVRNSALVQNRDDLTVGEFRAALAEDGNAIRSIGTPGQLADEMEELAACGLDGFNIVTGPMPSGVTDIVELLIPELQARGLYRTEYGETTLRERLLGPGRRHLPPTHPGRSSRK